MALTKFDKDLNIVSALDNEPNDVGGLTSEELKAKFDEGGKAIQEYINDTLIPETEAAVDGVSGRADEVRNELKKDMEDLATKEELRGVVLGQIPDGTITEEKLDPAFVDSRYTKAETLSDAVKAEYGKDSSAVPNDLFEELSDSLNKVGDIKVSLRNDLGDKWLLCNGAVLDPAECPKLAELLPEPTSVKNMPQTNIPAYYFGSDYANGICVALGYSTSGYLYRYIGTLDEQISYTSLGEEHTYYHTVRYDNESGIWCMAYSKNGVIYSLATTDPVNGTWTSKESTLSDTSFGHMYSGNAVWVAASTASSRNSSSEVTSSTAVSVITDPINGTWSAPKTIGSRGAGSGDNTHVYYHNGVWVVATSYEESRSAGGGGGVVVYTTDDPVNGTWAMQTIVTNASGCSVMGLSAHDGKWILLIYNGYNTFVYTTNDPASTWESAQTATTYSSTSYNWYPRTKCLKYHRGKWYAMGKLTNADTKLFLFSAEDPTGEWTNMLLYDATTNSSSMCADEKALIVMYLQGTTQNKAYYLAQNLPTISNDGAYTYIKAKE